MNSYELRGEFESKNHTTTLAHFARSAQPETRSF